MSTLLRKWFIAGLLVWIPLGATLLVIRFLVGALDTSLLLIPQGLRPDIPGLGVLLSLVLVLSTGAIAANFLGSQAVSWAEELLARIPVVRSVYGGLKKLTEQVFSGSGSAFRKVVLFEYPRKGVWSVGFLSADAPHEISAAAGRADLVAVFVPTTPNPTSGFIMLVPRAELIELPMTVQQGMQYVISLGVVAPEIPKN
ncbi:MAG: DUF502 domain-containing protein [Pseudomonadota bacterium]